MSNEKQSGDSGIPAPVLPTVQASSPRRDAPGVESQQAQIRQAALPKLEDPARHRGVAAPLAGKVGAPGPEIEIKWGGKIFRFANKAAALAANFHIED